MPESYNGWPASPDPKAIGIEQGFEAGGVHFPGGVKAGDVAAVLGYVATQIHLRVERLVAGWCWGYDFRVNRNDPNTLSCHSSGTALDINSPRHENGAYNTFTPDQVATIRRIMQEVRGVVAWGRDWTGTKDEMHFEIQYGAARVKAAAATLGRPAEPPRGLTPFPLPAGYYFGPLSGPTESISGMAADGSDTKYRPAIARIQGVVRVVTDGLYGPHTMQSVRGWQAAHNLQVDGLTGPRTWLAMRL
jgi:peptidoglycan hydrolase-like protein with peptidoglycan-binding domain